LDPHVDAIVKRAFKEFVNRDWPHATYSQAINALILAFFYMNVRMERTVGTKLLLPYIADFYGQVMNDVGSILNEKKEPAIEDLNIFERWLSQLVTRPSLHAQSR